MSDFENKPSNASTGVGYGRPPQHSKFKPGQSGNPKGRPKRVKTATDIVRSVLNEKMKVVVDGKIVRMAKLEAICRQLTNKALKGELRAIRDSLSLAKQMGLLKYEEEAFVHEVVVTFVRPPDREAPCVIDEAVKVPRKDAQPLISVPPVRLPGRR